MDLKNAVEIKVLDRDGVPILVVRDNHLNLEFHEDLPLDLESLPPSKQNYWINKELQKISKKITRHVQMRKEPK